MAPITRPTQKHYDVLAEALTADGRVVKRVEARADDLKDVAEAFRLAAAEARQAHLKPARIRLSASRGGSTEVSATLEESEGPLAQSALLDGKTKLDAPPPVVPPPPHTRAPAPLVAGGRCLGCGNRVAPGSYHVCIPTDLPRPVSPPTAVDRDLEPIYRAVKALRPDWTVGVSRDQGRASIRIEAIDRMGASVSYRVTDETIHRAMDPRGLLRAIVEQMGHALTQP